MFEAVPEPKVQEASVKHSILLIFFMRFTKLTEICDISANIINTTDPDILNNGANRNTKM
jgi:hypothetical protein